MLDLTRTLQLLAAAVTATVFSSAAVAQQSQRSPPSPDQMEQLLQTTMGTMVAVMGPMTAAIIEAQLAIAAKPETAARIAAFKSNLYQALLQRGFTNADAMQIVVTTPLPSASPAAK
jgi:hypothetical protein